MRCGADGTTLLAIRLESYGDGNTRVELAERVNELTYLLLAFLLERLRFGRRLGLRARSDLTKK